MEILDVDLRALDAPTFARIHELFVRYGLIFFRDQSLSETDHIAFAQRFGTINVNRFFTSLEAHPEVALVAKDPEQRKNIGGGWHTDHSYDREPALGSVLVARELPPRGGDTWFVNVSDAFARLPDWLQRRLRPLRARHTAKYVFGSRGAWIRRLAGSDRQEYRSEVADQLEDAVHPMVIRHPLSGRETLYVNPAFTVGIEGWLGAAAFPLLGALYLHAIRPAHVAKFRWAPGSVAVWDNRATWHFAQNDYPGHRRVMHRITLDGCPLESA